MQKTLPHLKTVMLLLLLSTCFKTFAQVPSISSLTPASGAIGSTVIIDGANFDATAANNIVYFGGAKATVNAASSTQLSVTVPTGATYKPVSVTVGALTARSAKPFNVTFSNTPSITTNMLAAQVQFTANTGSGSVTTSDADGDGKLDIITAARMANEVNVFRNTHSAGGISTGSLASYASLPAGTTPFTVVAEDLDGDGKQDIVAANRAGSTLSVYPNKSYPGTISYDAAVTLATAGTNWGVAIADLNVDGKPDIVTTNQSANSISVFINNSVLDTIVFASKVDFNTGVLPTKVAIGDFNGDNLPDIAVTNQSDVTISIFENTSSGGVLSLATNVDIPTGTTPYDIIAGDFDGDGKDDIINTGFGTNTISILQNIGAGGAIDLSFFAAPLDIPGDDLRAITIGDLDGDGRPDLAAAFFSGTTVSVYQNLSAAGAIAVGQPAIFDVGSTPYGVAIGDINNDSLPDLIVGNQGSNNVSVMQQMKYQTITFPPFGAHTLTEGSFPFSASASSGFPLTIHNSDSTVATISGGTVTILKSGTTVITAYQAGDAVYGAAAPVTQSLIIDGPTFTAFSPLTAPVGSSVTLSGTNFNSTPANNIVYFGSVRANVTAASATDLVVDVPAGSTYNAITITTNGTTISSPQPFQPSFPSTHIFDASTFGPHIDFGTLGGNHVAIGDIDGDGKPEIATATGFSDSTITIMENLSTPMLIDNTSLSVVADLSLGNVASVLGVEFADLDNDGKPDLIGVNNNVYLSIFRNISTGAVDATAFAPRIDIPITAGGSVVARDFDQDGKIDLAVAGAVLKNNSSIGMISFAPMITFNTPIGQEGITAEDFDGDGKIDIAAPNYEASGSISVYLNASTTGSLNQGDFDTEVKFPAGSFPVNIDAGDLNNDGKSDIVVPNESGDNITIFANTSSIGSLSFSAITLATGDFPESVAIVDLDGDGKNEIVVAEQGADSISIFQNIHSTGPLAATSFAPRIAYISADAPYNLQVGDVDGDGRPDVITSNNFNLSVYRNKSFQSIAFNGLATVTNADAPFDLTAVSSSGLPVSYQSADTTIISISGTKATIRKAGTTAIKAMQPGDNIFSAAIPSVQNIKVRNVVDSLALVDLYNATNGGSWTTRTNWLTQPMDTWYGVSVDSALVKAVDLSANNLTGPLPASLSNMKFIERINLANNALIGDFPGGLGSPLAKIALNGNQLSGIPDLSGITTLDTLYVENNKLTFEDLEPNVTIPVFIYSPQDSVDVAENVLASLNQDFSFTASIGGANNTYQWKKNGVDLASDTTAVLSLAAITFADEGVYEYEAMNTKVTGLTILSRKKILRVSSLQRDSIALTALFNETGGANWTNNDNWTSTSLGTGNWKGVTISNNRVIGLNLSNNNLTGQIPAVINDIENLDTIDISDNHIQKLPDMTLLSNLSSLDVSSNALTFESLIPNMSIPGFKYDSQAYVGTAVIRLVDAGKRDTVQVNVGGTGNLYQWTLNGTPIASADSAIYVIDTLNRATMGEYIAAVTNPAVPGLTINSAPQKILATANIEGFVSLGDTIVSGGEVTLFRITSGAYDTLTHAQINSEGGYSFTKVVLDDYQVLAFPDTSTYHTALPTYFANTIFWEEATTVALNTDTVANIVCEVEPTPLTGTGTISGYLEEPATNGRTKVNKRVEGAGVTARRVERSGRGKEETLTLVDYVFTDDNGEFDITNLTEGDYRLNIQYPGYPMDENSFLEIPVGSGLKSQVLVGAVVNNGKITVTQILITGTAEQLAGIRVFPNPASSQIQLQFPFSETGRTVHLVNATGANLSSELAEGKEKMLDISQYEAGMYLIKVNSAKKSSTIKLIIRK